MAKLNKSFILITTLALLGLGCLVYSVCTTMRGAKEVADEVSEEIIPTPFLIIAVLSYYDENSKWPDNIDELREFVSEHELALDLNEFESLSFLPKQNGNVAIEFTAYKDYAQSKNTTIAGKITGHGTFELSPPIKGE